MRYGSTLSFCQAEHWIETLSRLANVHFFSTKNVEFDSVLEFKRQRNPPTLRKPSTMRYSDSEFQDGITSKRIMIQARKCLLFLQPQENRIYNVKFFC